MNEMLKEWLLEFSHRPPLASQERNRILNEIQLKLSPQLDVLYRHCDGAVICGHDSNERFTLLPIGQISRARVAIYGRDTDDYGVPWVYALIRYGDGDFIGIDTAHTRINGEYPVVDCWHESFANEPEPSIIADDMFGFLNGLKSAGLVQFWL